MEHVSKWKLRGYTCLHKATEVCSCVCKYTRVLPPLPKGETTLCLQHTTQGSVLQRDITPSSLSCNCTHIEVHHIALKREDTTERKEATADGGDPAPTSSVNREKLLLLSCVQRRTVPPLTAGGSAAWSIKGNKPNMNRKDGAMQSCLAEVDNKGHGDFGS